MSISRQRKYQLKHLVQGLCATCRKSICLNSITYCEKHYILNNFSSKIAMKKYSKKPETKEKRRKYGKNWRLKNKERLAKYNKEYFTKYYENNKYKLKEYGKNYREKNKEKIKIRRHNQYLKNEENKNETSKVL